MSRNGAAKAAVAAGLRYLEGVQTKEGEFPVFSAFSIDMVERRHLDPCFFGTALIAGVLAAVPEASDICARARKFIEAQRRPGGLWTYYKKRHCYVYPPRDVDDTALAVDAFRACGGEPLGNRSIVLANRDDQGMFFTWILPWRSGPNLHLLAKDWRELFSLRRYRAFFRNSKTDRNDVDAGINANVLAAFAPFDGDERLIAQLLRILEQGREDSCDKYYDNPVLIRFFFSRALAGRCPKAGRVLVERAEVGPNASALDQALTILTRTMWNAPVPADLLERLIAEQAPSGEWPIASIYCAGREQLGYLNFAPAAADRFRSGSEAITTAFCIAALLAASRDPA
jgi:hypothetical protein